MSETDIINTISSSDQLRIDEAHKIIDSHSSIGERSILANSYSNPLYLGGGDPMIGKTFPKEVWILGKKLTSSIPTAFYYYRDQAIYNLMERLDPPPELGFLEEGKQGKICYSGG